MHTRASEESKQHEEIVSISSFFPCRIHFFTFWILIFSSSCRCLSCWWNYFVSPFFPVDSLLFWPRPFVPLTQSIHFFFWSQRICWLLCIKFFFMISLFYFSFSQFFFVSLQCCVSFFTRFHYPLSRLFGPKGVYSNVSQTILNPWTSEARTRPNW